MADIDYAALLPDCPECNLAGWAAKQLKMGSGVPFGTHVITVHRLAVDGRQDRLALVDWWAECRQARDGFSRYSVNKSTAYVVEERKLARYSGRKNVWYGRVRWLERWERRVRYRDDTGGRALVFPFDAAALEGTTAEHCKLDVFLNSGGMFPVSYLALWRKRPAVENLVVQGFGALLGEMLQGWYGNAWSRDSAIPRLPDLDLTQSRPSRMLGLDAAELRLAREMRWTVSDLESYKAARDAGLPPRLPGDVEALTRLPSWSVRDMLNDPGRFWRSVRYLARQRNTWSILRDYWEAAMRLGRDLDEGQVRYPKNLSAAHDRAVDELREARNAERREALAARLEELRDAFQAREKALRPLCFQSGGLLIRPCADGDELIREGKELHHCVANYGERHAGGGTAIFFIRKTDAPDEPFFTLELDEQDPRVRQNRGRRNCERTPEVRAFEDQWMAWVRSGGPERRKKREEGGGRRCCA